MSVYATLRVGGRVSTSHLLSEGRLALVDGSSQTLPLLVSGRDIAGSCLTNRPYLRAQLVHLRGRTQRHGHGDSRVLDQPSPYPSWHRQEYDPEVERLPQRQGPCRVNRFGDDHLARVLEASMVEDPRLGAAEGLVAED